MGQDAKVLVVIYRYSDVDVVLFVSLVFFDEVRSHSMATPDSQS